MPNRSFADLQAMQRLPLALRKRRNKISEAKANAPDTIPILP